VTTSEGSVSVLTEVSDEMKPGVVSLPHGWGHGRDGTSLDIANSHPGVNSNLLNPAGLIDVPSNTQVVNGVPCEVRPADRPPIPEATDRLVTTPHRATH
jgi:anaerobic selenocysteine-containing dehydrogenase